MQPKTTTLKHPIYTYTLFFIRKPVEITETIHLHYNCTLMYSYFTFNSYVKLIRMSHYI